MKKSIENIVFFILTVSLLLIPSLYAEGKNGGIDLNGFSQSVKNLPGSGIWIKFLVG